MGLFASVIPRFIPPCLLAALCLAAAPAGLRAQSHDIGQADPGLLEAGSPLFAVLTKENLGLNSPPTDFHIMPDGRVLVVAGQQLAFGDGVRWEVFRQAANDAPARALTVAIDANGDIYQAVTGGFARVVFGEDGQWRLRKVADWPASESADRAAPRTVVVAGEHWFWHSNSGSIISWRPGETAVSVAYSNDVEKLFSFDDEYFLSDRVVSDGAIIRIDVTGKNAQGPREKTLPYGLITCALPFGNDVALLGSSAHGIQVFDGHQIQPLVREGVLAGGYRINDLCPAGNGFYAAAVENYGVVFFDSQGRTIQDLNRIVDHRLGRVTRIMPGPGGVVWGLLTDGIFQVRFPSRFSYFEPLISTGLASAHPRRINGRLWIAADNQLVRAAYNQSGRMTGFERDTPEGEVVFTLSNVSGLPIASTSHGAFYRTPAGWEPFASQAANLRIPRSTPVDGQWIYTARDEAGWLRLTDAGPQLDRQPQPGLGDIYNANTDGRGDIWLERGTGRLARIRASRPGEPLQVDLFGAAEGVPQGWAQVFVVDGVARFNIADRILKLDAPSGRLVVDEDFAREFKPYGTIVGRPGRDALGRLWVSTESGIYLFSGELGHLQQVPEPMPGGFQPYYFTFETGGVVWLHSTRRFARYDPLFPTPQPQPLRALITHVTLPSTGRTLYPRDGALPELSSADNTLIPHFLSIGNSSLAPVTFEVKLDGSGQDWVSAGSVGSTVFNRLGEGQYTLQVRPSSLGIAGEISTLRFVITPPWYRTFPAYTLAAIVLGVGIVMVGRLFTYLDRREKRRLEQLVSQRTRELATQVEENRTLSQALQQSPVGVLLIRPDGAIVFANSRVGQTSGYTLAELVGRPVEMLRETGPEQVQQSQEFAAARLRGESWQAQLLNRAKDGRAVHVRATASPLRSQAGDIALYLILEEDITESLAEQERRRRLETQLAQAQKRESLGTLAGGIAHDFNNILTGILGYCELAQLTLGRKSLVEQELLAISAAGRRAKDLVSQILSFTRPGQTQLIPLDLARPVREALKLVRASTPASIEIGQSLQSAISRADSSQIHQVILNLCTNAVHALRNRSGRIEVSVDTVQLDANQAAEYGNIPPGEYRRLRVSDNGSGMESATLDRIFDPFFTTKDPGEGTGLGLSIVHSIVLGHHGGIRVRSAPGAGTTFDLVFPASEGPKPDSTPPMAVPVGGQQEILIVDDEQMVTDFVAARLKQLSYKPTVRNDPRTALLDLTAEPRRFAVLITDLTMPHMSGVELIHELHRQGIIIPALIITGYNRNSNRADLASLPNVTVLQKPFTGDELAQALHRVIADNPAAGL